MGNRLDRKLSKYSDNFNEIFNFFLSSYRKGILTFCGSIVNVEFDINESEGKNTFRKFDNGQYSGGKPIVTRHPNIVKAVIVGKKAWGLWCSQWSEGIAEGTFTKIEILEEFESKGIKIPTSLMKDFEDRVWKKRFEYFKKHS
jgi:hypothetical protein